MGAAKSQAPAAWRLVELRLPGAQESVNAETFGFGLCKERLREALRREGCYLLRTNLNGGHRERDDDDLSASHNGSSNGMVAEANLKRALFGAP